MWRVALALIALWKVHAANLRRNETSSILLRNSTIHKQSPVDLQPGNLVFDFGFYDGADSRSYLTAGMRVIAVEADPSLVQEAWADSQLRTWLNIGQLTLVNTAISPEGNTWTTFYLNHCTREWNSFYSSIGCRTCQPPYTESPAACVAQQVQATSCASLLQQYGVPQYFKLDIEGAESGCYAALWTLPQEVRPFWISAEVGNAALVDTLHGLGYKSFKLIQQQSGVTGAWGANAKDCRTGNLWRSYEGAKAELNAVLSKAAVAGDVCPGSLVAGNWYDLHASMQTHDTY